MWDCVWPAPAKLNLFLHVTGRRGDGYHELQTLFQFVDVGDALHIRQRADGEIRRLGGAPGIAVADDLVTRAAHLLRAAAGGGPGADIFVHKRIPVGGGLGGGSSDAATALVALNRLWGLDLPDDRLCELALELGADVPVFVRGEAAWAEGVGERLQPMQPPEPWYVVVTPPVAVPTGEVFGAAELTRDTPPITIRDFLAGRAGNACEPVVRTRYATIDAAFRTLSDQGLKPRLSGTGCSVFAECASACAARVARAGLPADLPGFVTRGLNRSPLAVRLSGVVAR